MAHVPSTGIICIIHTYVLSHLLFVPFPLCLFCFVRHVRRLLRLACLPLLIYSDFMYQYRSPDT